MARAGLVRGALPIVAVAALFCAAGASAEDGEQTDDALMGFVEGKYAIVGSAPDGGAAYGGTATIELDGKVLRMTRRVDGKEIAAEGAVEIPAPPGERRVLRFHWQEPVRTTMTCLVHSDLDNYARLTCIWLADGSAPAQPGVEALFPTATWEAPEAPE
jgi:hypothetical protein